MKYLFILAALTILFACSGTEEKSYDKYTIEQFYENTRYRGGSFSEDETRLLVSSDETGIFNVFEINISNGKKKQITFSDKESFFAIDYVPGTGQIIYSADQGGNELSHIYLLKDDTTSIDLTPGDNQKANFLRWSDDKKSMYFTSNKRDPKFFDVYKMGIETWKAEMIYQNDEGFGISDISHDENLISLTKSITTSEKELFLYDRNQKLFTEISDETGSYSSSGFSMDDSSFYYITDVGKEFAYLVSYEIATGETKTIYEAKWDVIYSKLSKNGKYRVIAINEDGRNKLVLLDNKTMTPVKFPDIPDGDVTAIKISESEAMMRLNIGTSKAPNDIYVYSFENKSLKKLSESLNPEIKPENLVSAEVVRYKSFDGLEIPSIFYKPLSATDDHKVPALVWVHGGPGGQSRVGYFSLIQYLVNNGYALLAVNNRGSMGYGKTFYKGDDRNHGDGDLKDCIWGKKWLQEQDYIDKDKIGIIGGSYGGYMTMAAMAFTPDEFKVGVNIFGVTNWIRTLKSIPPYWESYRKALYAELGDPWTSDSVRLMEISPLFHADNVKNPVMVLQGANDPRVLQVESDEIVEAMKKNNVPVEYIIFPDEGHGFIKKDNEIKGYKEIKVFLDKYLLEKNVK